MEQDNTVQQQGKIWYVEALRNAEEYPEGDAWISITDAARITRTSEAMARRWVSSGRIPAKKETVGINARTRLVRLSDVAQIRPIIDPSAAITDEVRLIDLPSIPRQMQEIMENHEHLLVQVETLQTAVGEIHQAQQTLQETFTTQIQELTNRLAVQLNVVSKQIDTEQERIGKLATWVTEQDQAIVQRLDESTQRLTSELEVIRTDHQKVATRLGQLFTVYEEHRQILTRHANQIGQLESQIAGFPSQIELVRTALQALLEQQVKDIYTEIHQLAQDEAHDAMESTKHYEELKRQVGNVATKNEAATTIGLGAQRRIDEANEKISALQKQLNDERSAREIMAQQIQVLLQHVNTPHARVESTPPSTTRKRKTTTTTEG